MNLKPRVLLFIGEDECRAECLEFPELGTGKTTDDALIELVYKILKQIRKNEVTDFTIKGLALRAWAGATPYEFDVAFELGEWRIPGLDVRSVAADKYERLIARYKR